jgi:hypothetical protein
MGFFFWTKAMIDRDEAAKMLDGCSAALREGGSELQGAVLADLLSMWLAGHIIWNDPAGTQKMREELLRLHVKAVLNLIPANEKQIMERFARANAHLGKN